ncbi:fibronectin type III domain-containing protein [Singulisphaera sp. PoT]|uniref:fibronectin type III domain-containing protein n=1 Tax=Singulisphaera sp. PoT TaxID=3411797 RepID=UPI003BF4A606
MVYYTVTGNASATDYTGLTSSFGTYSVTIPAGQASVTMAVTPVADTVAEPDETLILALSSNSAYVLGNASSATVVIAEDTAATAAAVQAVTIVATDSNAAEAGPNTGTFTVTRTGPTASALVVYYTVTGNASATDYTGLTSSFGTYSVTIPAGQASVTMAVTPVADTVAEPDETLILALSSNSAYVLGNASSATVVIAEDTAATAAAVQAVTIVATDSNAAEAGQDPAVFIVSRTGPTSSALTVYYTLIGTASTGDYTGLTSSFGTYSVTIPAGQASVTMAVTPVADTVAEPDETIVLALSSNSAYALGNLSVATAVITDSSPTTPANLAAAIISSHQVDLSWSDTLRETGFIIERSTNGANVWTQIGTAGADATSYSDTTANDGTRYDYRVRAYNGVAASPNSNTAIVLIPLATPTGVSATFVSPTRIEVNWTDQSSAELNYSIERSLDGTAGWQQLGSVTLNTTAFSVSGPFNPSTAYYFRVRAYNTTAGYSTYSSTATVTTPAFPNTPTLGTVVATSDVTVNLTWTDIANEDGYRIERSSNGGTTWTTAGTVGAGVTNFTDNGLTEGSSYSYRLLAVNAAGDSIPSATRTVATLPTAPSDLSATVVSGSRIDVSWTDRSAAEAGYYIERSLDGATGWQQLGSVAANATTFAAPGPYNGSTTYYFRVRAYANTGGYSSYSATASVTTPAFPNVPTLGTVVSQSDTAVNLTWTDLANEDGYRIERSSNGGTTWTTAGTVGAGVTNFTDNGLTEARSYSYRLFATNAVGDSAPSATRTVATLPTAPANVSAAAISPSRIDVSWTDRSAAEAGYYIERSLDGATGWQQLGSVAANATTFAAPGPYNGSTTYYFRVRAYSLSYGTSVYSATASVTTPAFPNMPAIGTATPQSDTSMSLTWADVAGEDSYRIERSTNGGSTWTTAGTVSAGVTSFTDSGLTEATRYYYRVIATNAVGDSAPSVSVTNLTLPAAPSGLSATPVSATLINLNWVDRSNGETGTKIELSSSPDGPWTQIATTGANVTAFAAPGAFLASTTYYFRIMAYNGVGNSAPVVVSATTGAWPNAPLNLVVVPASLTQLDVSWSPSVGATGYVVERSANGTSGWTQVATPGAGATAYSDTGLTQGTPWWYRVRATNANGGSPYSTIGSATTLYYTPTVVTPAAANPGIVTGKTAALSVLGNVQGGEARLRYLWSAITVPDGVPAPIFAGNNTNFAKNTTVTFAAAGSYLFRVTIINGTESVASDVAVTVNQAITTVKVKATASTSPNAKVIVQPGATQQFTAEILDQFGLPFIDPVSVTWSLTPGSPGAIDLNGLYTAPDEIAGESEMASIVANVTEGGAPLLRNSSMMSLSSEEGVSGSTTVEVTERITIDFDDLTAGTVVTNQYPYVKFSGDPAFPNQVLATTDASAPNSLGAPTPPPNGDGVGNPYIHPLYVDFSIPVEKLRFTLLRDDASGAIAQVRVYEKGTLSATVPLNGTATVSTPEHIDLTAYHKVTRIEIVNITDPAGLLWDDFSFIAGPDLDIDSDNNDKTSDPDRSDDEDDAENPKNQGLGPDQVKPGKVILANVDDTDGDGVADLLDGYGPNAEVSDDERFTPVKLQLPDDFDLERFKLSFKYNAAAPGMAKDALSENAALRLWTKDGSKVRLGDSALSNGDFIRPGEDYEGEEDLAKLNFSDTDRTITLYVEGLFASRQAADQAIKVMLSYKDAKDNWKPAGSDTVRVTILQPYTTIDDISADDPKVVPVIVAGPFLETDGGEAFDPDRFLEDGPANFQLKSQAEGATGWTNASQKSVTMNEGGAAAYMGVTSRHAGDKYRVVIDVMGYKVGTDIATVIPGKAAVFEGVQAPSNVVADGVSTRTLSVTVKDAHGNLVADGTPVDFIFTSSNIKDKASEEAQKQNLTVNGRAEIEIVAGTKSAEAPEQVILIQCGDAEATIQIGLNAVTLTMTSSGPLVLGSGQAPTVSVQTNAAAGAKVYFLFSNGKTAEATVGGDGSAAVTVPTTAYDAPGKMQVLVSCGNSTISGQINVVRPSDAEFSVDFSRSIIHTKGSGPAPTYQLPGIANPLPGTTLPPTTTLTYAQYRPPTVTEGQFEVVGAPGFTYTVSFLNPRDAEVAELQSDWSLFGTFIMGSSGRHTIKVVSTSATYIDGTPVSTNGLPRAIPVLIQRYNYPVSTTPLDTRTEWVYAISDKPTEPYAYTLIYDTVFGFLGLTDPETTAGIAANFAGGMLAVGDAGSIVKNLWRMAGFSDKPVNYYELTLSSLGLLTELLPLAGEVPDGLISTARALVAALGVAPLGGILMEVVRDIAIEGLSRPEIPQPEGTDPFGDVPLGGDGIDVDTTYGEPGDEAAAPLGSGLGGGAPLMTFLLSPSALSAGKSAAESLLDLLKNLASGTRIKVAGDLITSKAMYNRVWKFNDYLGENGYKLWDAFDNLLKDPDLALSVKDARKLLDTLTELPDGTSKAIANLAAEATDELGPALKNMALIIKKGKIDAGVLKNVLKDLPNGLQGRWPMKQMLEDLASISEVNGFQKVMNQLTVDVSKWPASKQGFGYQAKLGRLYELQSAAKLSKTPNLKVESLQLYVPARTINGTKVTSTDIDVVTVNTVTGERIFWQAKRSKDAFVTFADRKAGEIRQSPIAAENWILKAQAQADEMGGATIRYITGSDPASIDSRITKVIEDKLGDGAILFSPGV